MFTRKPTVPYVRKTREELHREFVQFRRDSIAYMLYALFIFALFITCAIVEAMKPTDLEVLHSEICEFNEKSPLCKDFTLLERIDSIASPKWVPTRLVVGVMNAESSLMTNYNKPACSEYHNHWGLKWKKYDDWRVEMYAVNRKKPDKNGCYLYRFKDFEDGVKSFVNTISMWYRGCDNNVTCISYDFVGDPNKSETSWVKNVETFFKKV